MEGVRKVPAVTVRSAAKGRDEFRSQTEHLARSLLDALDRPEDDPELVAARAEKERRQKAIIEENLRKTGMTSGASGSRHPDGAQTTPAGGVDDDVKNSDGSSSG